MALTGLATTQPDPRPWYMGHNGGTNLTRGEISRRARSILESPEYRESLERRLKSDSLPAAVEVMLYHYGYGKPLEQVEITLKDDLSQLSPDQLLKRAEELRNRLADMQAVEAEVLQAIA